MVEYWAQVSEAVIVISVLVNFILIFCLMYVSVFFDEIEVDNKFKIRLCAAIVVAIAFFTIVFIFTPSQDVVRELLGVKNG